MTTSIVITNDIPAGTYSPPDLRYTAASSSENGFVFDFTVTDMPPGGPSTGAPMLLVIPNAIPAGTYASTDLTGSLVLAGDAGAQLVLNLTTSVSQPMTFSGSLPNANVGVAYNGNMTLGGTFVQPVTIGSVSGTIPSWMTVAVSGTTVTFSGTPSAVGTDVFTPQATDSTIPTPQVATGPEQSVQVTTSSMTFKGTLPTAIVGNAYSANMTLGGTFVSPVTISATAGGAIPSWMTVTVSGTTVTFSGTPSDVGTDNFTPQATDSTTPTPQVAIGPSQSVAIEEPMTMAATTMPDAIAGVPYSQNIELLGYFSKYPVIDASAGAMPSWMSAYVYSTNAYIATHSNPPDIVTSNPVNLVNFSGTPPTSGAVSFTPRATVSMPQLPNPMVAVGSAQNFTVASAQAAETLVNQPVTLVASLDDGTNVNITVNAGTRTWLVPGSMQYGSLMYHSDGASVCIENCFMGTTLNLAGQFTLTASNPGGGTTTLFDGQLTIGAYKRTRPFWLQPPTAKTTPDWSAWPNYGGGANATSWTAYLASNNGPMGQGLAETSFGGTGDHLQLSGPEWLVDMITNPTAENATIIRGMSDSAARWGIHVVDPATNTMVDMSTNPYISFGPYTQHPNPIVKTASDGSQDSLDQAQAHACYFSVGAAELYGTAYDAEECGFWCNYYNSLWANPNYRDSTGCTLMQATQTRGRFRGLEYAILCGKYAATPALRTQFSGWAQTQVTAMKNTYTAQTGITADQSSGITDPAGSISGWMQAMLISALAMAIYHGYADAQETLDYFMPFFSDGILGDGNTNPSVSHEMLTLYRIQLIVDGVPVPNLRGAYEAMMTFNDPHYQPNFPNGWPQPENSVARISGLMGSGYNPSQYQGGDYCNYPTSPTGYAANLNCAVNAIKQYATDQTTALAIWNAFQPHVARIDFSTTAKYNRISFG